MLTVRIGIVTKSSARPFKGNVNYVVDFTKRRIRDEDRFYLHYTGQTWKLVNFAVCKPIKRQLKRIALVLESPHIHEYDLYYNPIGPAQGKTGKNIKNKLTSRQNLITHLNHNNVYLIRIMNPIQFQASCYHSLNNHDRNETKKVFRFLFGKKGFNLRQNFIFRLRNYNPDIIYNCCTSELKTGVVKTAINSAIAIASNQNYYEDIHPSMWTK